MASQTQPHPTTPSSAAAQKPAELPESAASQTLHEIQLRYKLAPSTFKTLCTIQTVPTRPDILKKACFATEFRTFPIKKAETAFFRGINEQTAIPYPVSENISQPWHKVFLLVQIQLLRAAWPNRLSGAARKELHQELARINKLLDHVLRCLVDILGERGDGKGVQTALDVLRSVKAGVWEGSDNQLLQVEGIGPAKKDRLVRAGIKNIKKLSKLEFYHIERLLSRNPPFGQTMLHKLAGFPMLTLDFEIISQHTPDSRDIAAPSSLPSQAVTPAQNDAGQSVGGSLWIARVVLGFANEETPSWNARSPWASLLVEGANGRLVWFWRGSVKRLVGGKEMAIGMSTKKGEELKITFACEEIVGTMVQKNVQV
ncbi:hypothetical protein FZEAL_5293 [Fusarium zealandicum]|uniref:SEC63 domain-containing protein n=1 Tax=Fusarium zealandicum TaxID=1053134 RepID=A0A8H4UKR4_9HYPO|nr:hypothetical protein FZEAL_5293 [Fusarium zealandicum]